MTNLDGEGLTNLVGEDLSLRIPNEIHSDGPFVSELLKERQQHAGVANLHAVDSLEQIVTLQSNFVEESKRHHAIEAKSVQFAVGQVRNGLRLGE